MNTIALVFFFPKTVHLLKRISSIFTNDAKLASASLTVQHPSPRQTLKYQKAGFPRKKSLMSAQAN